MTVLFLYDLLHVNFILDMKTENSDTDSVNKLKAEKEVTKEDDEKDKEDNSIDDDSIAARAMLRMPSIMAFGGSCLLCSVLGSQNGACFSQNGACFY